MPQIADNDDAPDFAAWLLTVPGIPADWGCEGIVPPLRPIQVPFHSQEVGHD